MKDEILTALKQATESYQRSIVHNPGTAKKLKRLEEAFNFACAASVELNRQMWLNDQKSVQPK